MRENQRECEFEHGMKQARCGGGGSTYTIERVMGAVVGEGQV
jgi:hypothetical protein